MANPSRTTVWLQAFRLHTLPLALAGIALGNFIAYSAGLFHPGIAALTLMTAICLQILSNLANDYGDTRHGADSEERSGPARMVQSGHISSRQIKGGILVFILLSLACGCFLLFLSLKNIGVKGAMSLFLLGLASIAAAIAYTASKKPYGYRGLGDLSVFIFFGLVAVYGSFFLQTGNWEGAILLPATGMGLLCAAVLNVNNVRDIEADARANKRTIAVQLGLNKAKIYHWSLLLSGIACFIVYIFEVYQNALQFLFLLPLLLFIWNGYGVWKSKTPQQINPYLKQLVLSIFFFTICFGLALTLFKP
jgi:1,4-dihydroxy-2-naphthoate octaprenyltransferase